MANQASAELFLDILTKEEKEALLSKKMEEIRKKNDALRKRHEEIQKDKKVADSLMKPSPTDSSGSNSPIKEKQIHANDRKFQDKPKNNNRPAGRGKPRPKSGGDFNHVQNSRDEEFRFRQDTPKRFSFGEHDRPKDFRFGEHDDRDASPEYKNYHNEKRGGNRRNFRGRGGRGGSSDHYKENRSDNYNRQDSWNSNEEYYDKRDFRKSGDFSRQDSRGRGRGRNDYNRQDSRSSGEDIYDKRDFRNSGDFSRQDSRGRGGGNQYNRQGFSNGNRHSGEFKRNNYKDHREQFDDSEFDLPRKRPHGGSHNYYDDGPDGPPPDPQYNFLSDRSREGTHKQQDRSDRREPPRRHPKNFGGQDFSNVKNQMKNVKERQQNRSGPPKSKMEMTVTMTGKERREYMEWKADRERVDSARIERQKSSSGEWKREWDKEKIESDEIKQTEPARRPAGRIGSGRFDRGEKDERQKVHPEEAPRGSSEKGRHRPETPTKSRGDAPPRGRGNRHPETPPRMAGRGRGRGRGKAKSANEAKPQRVRSTSSGDERVVNCDSDLLVIKLENTPGDNSVEVEYSDGEVPVTKSSSQKQGGGGGATGTATHGAQTEELWWDEDDDLTMSLVQDGLEGDDVLEHRQLFDDAEHEGDEDSHEIVVGEDEDEWEDCDDDSFYSTEKSQTSTDSREGYGNQLTVNTQLNPDAPEFTPTSPLSSPSPRSPREKRLKTKHEHDSKSSKAKAQNESSSQKDTDKNVGKNSKTGQQVSVTDVTDDQKGTKGCENSGQEATDGTDQKSGQETKDLTDQKVSEDTDVSKGQNDLQEGGKTDVDSSKETDSQIKSKQDLSTSSRNDDKDDQKAHSETASDGGDSTSAEGVVTKEVETSGSVNGVDNTSAEGVMTGEVDTSVSDGDDATKEESVEDNTMKSESGEEDSTVVGAKDTKTTEDSCDGAVDGTTEQMANKETKEDIANDKKLEESSKDDQKESDE